MPFQNIVPLGRFFDPWMLVLSHNMWSTKWLLLNCTYDTGGCVVKNIFDYSWADWRACMLPSMNIEYSERVLSIVKVSFLSCGPFNEVGRTTQPPVSAMPRLTRWVPYTRFFDVNSCHKLSTLSHLLWTNNILPRANNALSMAHGHNHTIDYFDKQWWSEFEGKCCSMILNSFHSHYRL